MHDPGTCGSLHVLPGGGEHDQVARWERLRATYPQACYSVDDGWFYGALRDEDNVLRRSDLGRLIDSLLARETHSDGPGLSPAR